MVTADSAHVWTVIGVLAASLFGMLTLMSTLFVRVVRAEIGGLRHEVRAEIGGLRADLSGEIAGLRGELNARIDGLDRDIQFLMAREADRG